MYTAPGALFSGQIFNLVGPYGWRYVFFVGIAPALLLLLIRRGMEEPAHFRFEMPDLFGQVLNFPSEYLPLRRIPRDSPDGDRDLDDGARDLALPLTAELLVAHRDAVELLRALLVLSAQHSDFGKLLANLGLTLHIGRRAFFHVTEVDQIV